MKISVISINYAPEPTGISVYTTGMSEYLSERDWDVTVHTGFPYYPNWKKKYNDRQVLFRAEQMGKVKLRRCYLFVPRAPSALKRIIHEFSFCISASISYLMAEAADLTIIVSPPLPIGIPIALLAKLKGSKTLFHVQDLQPDAAVELGMLKPGLLTKILYGMESLTYRLVDWVSTISLAMQKNIQAKGVDEKKMLIFKNWADDDTVMPMSDRDSYRYDWSLQNKFVVLYSGNMGVKQGLGMLLAVAKQLSHLDDIVFVIVGDGGEKQTLINRANEQGLHNVRFTSPVPKNSLGRLLATADVSVIPQKEGMNDVVLPSKLNNILCSQKPVIVAARQDSELAHIVQSANCGLVVEPGQAEQMVKAIVQLHADQEERQLLARNGREYALQYLSRKGILDQFMHQAEGLIKPQEAGEMSTPIRS
ncbi:WcaI family glycosyltransferase [Ampullimonas aquatilis]|uniref:WcaI family glycosyltransferase n=1 Tax=Ampullimonas aquatilis TaxID=1341549 RepID=UPI003C78F1EC